MHTVNLTIKKNYIKRDGTTPIYLQYNFSNSKRTLIKSGKHIAPNFWNPKTKWIRRNLPDFDNTDQYLKSLKHRLENIIDDSILNGKTPSIDYVVCEFYTQSSPEKNRLFTFTEILDQFIESKKSTVVKDVIKDYNSLKKHLNGFQEHHKKKLSFSNINLKFYEEFVYYLEYIVVKKNGEVGMQKSTVGKLIKNFKVFIRYCENHGHTKPLDLSGFKVLNSKSKDIYISESELDTMLIIDLSQEPELDKIRDLFIIGCETGLRFSDFSRISHDHITEKFIHIITLKTIEDVIIPISNRLRIVLDKYKNRPPNNIKMNAFNEHIKTIGKMANIKEYVSKIKVIGNQKKEVRKMKYHFMSSHTCRRSFCTNQFLKGMPPLLIRKISGHSDERSFLRYIKIDEKQAAEMMLKKWIEAENS